MLKFLQQPKQKEMYYIPPENFLYSAYKIKTKHSDGQKVLEGTATAFLLDIGSGIAWIITNRHVLDIDYKKSTPKYKDFKLVSLELTGRKPDDTEYTIQIVPSTHAFFDNNYENDVAMILPKATLNDNQNFEWHFNLNHLASEENFEHIIPYDVICYSGFPETHDKFMRRPILRSGRIASDPKFNYSWDEYNHGDCIAYEGFSSPGGSGSPVFATARGLPNMNNSRGAYLIGVNAGHIPGEFGHSGISYFYKSTVIYGIIEQNKLEEIKVK
ncbi:hypothetical protein LCGC14_1793380 [marine sediment metagenome]|uniref:Serine protease n=1 Tax=marine sediment metagenome TaxID=412755 RepID=A0A0F9HEH4_9ZZZZ